MLATLQDKVNYTTEEEKAVTRKKTFLLCDKLQVCFMVFNQQIKLTILNKKISIDIRSC